MLRAKAATRPQLTTGLGSASSVSRRGKHLSVTIPSLRLPVLLPSSILLLLRGHAFSSPSSAGVDFVVTRKFICCFANAVIQKALLVIRAAL